MPMPMRWPVGDEDSDSDQTECTLVSFASKASFASRASRACLPPNLAAKKQKKAEKQARQDDWDETMHFWFLDKEGCEELVTQDDAGFDPKVFDACSRFEPPEDGEDAFAAAVAFPDTGEFYGAAVKEDEWSDPWSFFDRDLYIGNRINDDGITEEFEVDEALCLLDASKGNTTSGGFWMAGEKYSVCSSEELTVEVATGDGRQEGRKMRLTMVARPRQGAYIARTPAQIVVALWRGDADVNGGNCRWLMHNFMKNMMDQGIYGPPPPPDPDDYPGPVPGESSEGDTGSDVDESSDGDWKGC